MTYDSAIKTRDKVRRQRRKINQTYLRNKRVVKGLMRTSFASISIYDFIQHKVIYSQWRLLRSLGYAPEDYTEVSSAFFRKILHPDDAWVIENHMVKIRNSKPGEVLVCVFRIRDKNENYRSIALRDSVIQRNADGEVSRLIGSVMDITPYQNLKEQRDKSRIVLDHLSYRNSHELRSPIATILGLVTLLRYETRTSENVIDLLNSLELTVAKMDRVVRDFGNALHHANRDEQN